MSYFLKFNCNKDRKEKLIQGISKRDIDKDDYLLGKVTKYIF